MSCSAAAAAAALPVCWNAVLQLYTQLQCALSRTHTQANRRARTLSYVLWPGQTLWKWFSLDAQQCVCACVCVSFFCTKKPVWNSCAVPQHKFYFNPSVGTHTQKRSHLTAVWAHALSSRSLLLLALPTCCFYAAARLHCHCICYYLYIFRCIDALWAALSLRCALLYASVCVCVCKAKLKLNLNWMEL